MHCSTKTTLATTGRSCYNKKRTLLSMLINFRLYWENKNLRPVAQTSIRGCTGNYYSKQVETEKKQPIATMFNKDLFAKYPRFVGKKQNIQSNSIMCILENKNSNVSLQTNMIQHVYPSKKGVQCLKTDVFLTPRWPQWPWPSWSNHLGPARRSLAPSASPTHRNARRTVGTCGFNESQVEGPGELTWWVCSMDWLSWHMHDTCLIFSTHQIGVHVMIWCHTCMIRTRHLIGGMIDGLNRWTVG